MHLFTVPGSEAMKHRRIHIVVIVVLLLVTGGVTGSRSGPSEPVYKTSPETRLHIITPQSNRFADAAAKNASLRNDLSWIFGGKQQRGWYLYDTLLTKTLDTQSEATTADFAEAVAAWQKRRRLSSNGVLDEKSLMAMVSHWQSNRLKTRTPADPSQLLTAPPEDFYDPGRAAELRQVERNTYAAYKEMVAAAMADSSLDLKPKDRFLKIISSYRTRAYQDRLRQQSPNSGRAGLAVNSPHFTGRALDIYVGGSPVDTADANRAIQVNTRAYQWLVRNAERFGFRPYFYEPWHWEYVAADRKD